MRNICASVYLNIFAYHWVSVCVVWWERGMLGENSRKQEKKAHFPELSCDDDKQSVFSDSVLTHWCLKRIHNTHLQHGGDS